MATNCDSKNEAANEDERSGLLETDIHNLSMILKRVCEALLGKWESVIADAITNREMNARSVGAWKLCAKAGLVGGDVDAALDCLHEALHIDHKDWEACALLKSIVTDHLHKTLGVRSLNPDRHSVIFC